MLWLHEIAPAGSVFSSASDMAKYLMFELKAGFFIMAEREGVARAALRLALGLRPLVRPKFLTIAARSYAQNLVEPSARVLTPIYYNKNNPPKVGLFYYGGERGSGSCRTAFGTRPAAASAP